jgi:hypothetical protein
VSVFQRRYIVRANVTLLSIPVVSRHFVGNGFVRIEEAEGNRNNNTIAIQFGAGSSPANARGLNRLGFIEEVVVERGRNEIGECAYFAFMTASQEENPVEASAIPCVAAEGIGRGDTFTSRVHHFNIPAKLTWRDYQIVLDKVRAIVGAGDTTQGTTKKLAVAEQSPCTFLYGLGRALRSAAEHTARPIVYNGKSFRLLTGKATDSAAAVRFIERGLVGEGAQIVRVDATLVEDATGRVTCFKLWFESASTHALPVCFEYQARSFLRLMFEVDHSSTEPEFDLAMLKPGSQKEND